MGDFRLLEQSANRVCFTHLGLNHSVNVLDTIDSFTTQPDQLLDPSKVFCQDHSFLVGITTDGMYLICHFAKDSNGRVTPKYKFLVEPGAARNDFVREPDRKDVTDEPTSDETNECHNDESHVSSSISPRIGWIIRLLPIAVSSTIGEFLSKWL
jgi:hypothetical protein